jgi:hypothetical protein
MTTSEVSYPNSYNRELILDLTLEAWSVYDFAHDDMPRVHAYIPIPAYIVENNTVNVTDSLGVIVTDSSGNNVTVDAQTSVDRTTDPRKENFKFLVSQVTGTQVKVSLAEYRDYSFTDWVSFNGVGADFSSYLITGYNLAGDMARQKQVIYLQIFCKRTETVYTLNGSSVVLARQSGCYVQSQWDWAEDNTQGKWGTAFQAYRFLKPQPTAPAAGDTFLYGDSVIVTKNKLRGRGQALSLYIYSEAGKDMKLLGWNTLATVNGEPS